MASVYNNDCKNIAPTEIEFCAISYLDDNGPLTTVPVHHLFRKTATKSSDNKENKHEVCTGSFIHSFVRNPINLVSLRVRSEDYNGKGIYRKVRILGYGRTEEEASVSGSKDCHALGRGARVPKKKILETSPATQYSPVTKTKKSLSANDKRKGTVEDQIHVQNMKKTKARAIEAEKVTMKVIQEMQDIDWNDEIDASDNRAPREKQTSDVESSADNPHCSEVTENSFETTDASLSGESDLNDKVDELKEVDEKNGNEEGKTLSDVKKNAKSFEDPGNDKGVPDDDQRDSVDEEQTVITTNSGSMHLDNEIHVKPSNVDQTDVLVTVAEVALLSNFKINANADEDPGNGKGVVDDDQSESVDEERTSFTNDSSSMHLDNEIPVKPGNANETDVLVTVEDVALLSNIEINANTVEDPGNVEYVPDDDQRDSVDEERTDVTNNSSTTHRENETPVQQGSNDQTDDFDAANTCVDQAALDGEKAALLTLREEYCLNSQSRKGPTVMKIEKLDSKQKINLSHGRQISALLFHNKKTVHSQEITTPIRSVNPTPKRLKPDDDVVSEKSNSGLSIEWLLKQDSFDLSNGRSQPTLSKQRSPENKEKSLERDAHIEKRKTSLSATSMQASSGKSFLGTPKQAPCKKSFICDSLDRLNERSRSSKQHSPEIKETSIGRGAHKGKRKPSPSGESMQSLLGKDLKIKKICLSQKSLNRDTPDQLSIRSNPESSKQRSPQKKDKSLKHKTHDSQRKTLLLETSLQSLPRKSLPEISKQASSRKPLNHDALDPFKRRSPPGPSQKHLSEKKEKSLQRDAHNGKRKTSLAGTSRQYLHEKSLPETSKQASTKSSNVDVLNHLNKRSKAELSKQRLPEKNRVSLTRDGQGAQKKTSLPEIFRPSLTGKSSSKKSKQDLSGKLVNSDGLDEINGRSQSGPSKQRLPQKSGTLVNREAQDMRRNTSLCETSKPTKKKKLIIRGGLNERLQPELEKQRRSEKSSLLEKSSLKCDARGTQKATKKNVVSPMRLPIGSPLGFATHDASDDDNASIETQSQEPCDKNRRLKRKTLLTYPAEDLDRILNLGKQLVKTVELVIQNAERVDEFGDNTILRKLPKANEETGRIETTTGMTYHPMHFSAASTATTMRSRVKHLVYGLWDPETRMKLVMQRRKNNVPGSRVVTKEEVDEIISTALKLQGMELLARDGLTDTNVAREWISQVLKFYRFHRTHRDVKSKAKNDKEGEYDEREDQQVEEEDHSQITEDEEEDDRGISDDDEEDDRQISDDDKQGYDSSIAEDEEEGHDSSEAEEDDEEDEDNWEA